MAPKTGPAQRRPGPDPSGPESQVKPMARGGRPKDLDGPERRCIATGESGGTFGLIRFVVGPGDVLTPDLAERLPGRGIWLTSERRLLDLAVRKRHFSRAARQQVVVPDDLADLIERLLTARLIEAVSLSRKAGHAVAGFSKTEARLREGPVGALIEASDGSEPQRAKLRRLIGDAPGVSVLTGAELGVAFGRDTVIHAALDAGGLTKRTLRDAARLAGFRQTGDTARDAGDPGGSSVLRDDRTNGSGDER